MRRRIQIKIWPEIKSQTPALIPLSRIIYNKTNPIDIDFSNTHEVNACGLNILLVTLIKLTQKIENNEWDSIWPKRGDINELIRGLNFYKILIKNIPNQNLFWQNELSYETNYTPILLELEGLQTKTYPIYELDFTSNKKNKRKIVDEFKEHLIRELYFLQEDYDFELGIFIQILTEMAKNSADHTDGNAYFGLDISDATNSSFLKFSFGDLGIGINQRVREFVKGDKSFKDKAKHLAVTDAYHYALGVGITTLPNSKINKGIGMSTIFNLSKQLNIKLSVYDAESRGLLSSALNNSHVELRKIFYNVGFKVGFYYFGEIEIKK